MSVIARRFHDRAGNNLFQYAFARAYAERIGAELQTDPWWGQEVFGLTEKPIRAPYPQRADMEFESWNGEGNIEITGWCLHQKHLIYTRAEAKKWFAFTPQMQAEIDFVPSYPVAYHLRWGDFQTDPAFIAVSHKSYDKAFKQFVPFMHALPQMICAWDLLRRSTKLERMGLDWLPDFAALMRAERMFRANSTFSWWAATLGDSAEVFSPQLDGIAPRALVFQDAPFVRGNHPAISCFHPNCSDLYLPE